MYIGCMPMIPTNLDLCFCRCLHVERGCSSVVEHLLCMQKVLGSKPSISTSNFFFFLSFPVQFPYKHTITHVYTEDTEDEGANRLGNMSPPCNDGAGERVENGGLSRFAFSLTLERAKLTLLTEVKEVCCWAFFITRNQINSLSLSLSLSQAPSTASSDQLDSNIFHSASSEGHLLDLSPKSTTATFGTDAGLVYSDLTNIHLFSVSGYKGDPTLDYFCAQVCPIYTVQSMGALLLWLKKRTSMYCHWYLYTCTCT